MCKILYMCSGWCNNWVTLFKLPAQCSKWSLTHHYSHIITEFHLLVSTAVRHTCSVTLPLILACGTETYHFPAECQIFQESPYAKNHISKTLCSVLLRNQSRLGRTHDECPTYRTLYVSSCNVKITFSYISSWCHACSMVHGDYHFTQSTLCSVRRRSPSLPQLSYTVPTEAGLLWHNVDILGETIKGTPYRIWGKVLCSQYGHSDCRSGI